ncbi:MAG: peptide chain release factor 2 [Myxococcales bacterium]|nr:peptide chain release factor 2 [Myxococcales bacterium]
MEWRRRARCGTNAPWTSTSSRSRISSPPSGASWTSSGGIFDVEQSRRRVGEIEQLSAVDGFWNDQSRAQTLLKEKARLEERVTSWDGQRRALDDAQVLLDLALEADDLATAKEAAAATGAIDAAVGEMEFQRMLSGQHDRAAAMVSINAGAGGTDAQDWADMLKRMYLRWCERKGYEVEMLDEQPGEEAGLKSVTFTVTGDWAYGFLRAENGVHRLVRISPFDAAARRQTAFAAVFVYPELDDSIHIEIREEDLEWQTFRSGGAGGQHVNKTESAVRVIHGPTGVVAACQMERSQHKNRSMAMKMLRAKMFAIKLREQEEKMAGVHGLKKKIEWGSQIRSYVLAPYQQVNDHRTEIKIGNVAAVLDGDLDNLIRAYLLMEAGENEKASA